VDRKTAVIRTLLWALTVINGLWLGLVIAIYAVPLPDRTVSWSVTVEYRDGKPAHVFLAADDKWRLPVDLDKIDPQLVRALVALEDKRFWDHSGVDGIALVRAAWSDLTQKRRVSGGSTLSMQLARLLDPRRRTIPNKLVDMFRALQLDARLSKREILAGYLARTPYGRNLEGVESAAWSYFGHSAAHLSPVEIATILAVPQGPRRFAPSTQNAERLRAPRDRKLDKLIAGGVFSPADAEAARAEALAVAPPVRLRAMPRDAQHASVWYRARNPNATYIRTTLDPGTQALVEKVVALHAPDLVRRGIHNGAVVVVDHRSREVVGLAGNLDFTDWKHGGQLEMFARPRSPGSALKPLLYALAIDRGLALPDYLVADIPSEYGTYTPHNFDGDFAGLVTLREALERSLNLPFIALLDQLGVETFVGELQRSGVPAARAQPGKLGLSMIVGSVEITPLELASIFATLAEGGVSQPLRMYADKPAGATTTIYGKAAAYLTREALANPRKLPHVPANIHWKTGTSFGYRDAWSVGSDAAYTVAVWTGNVDNTPSRELVGSEAALPVLFDVLSSLADRTNIATAPARPDDLVEIEVCAFSGHIATDACPHKVKTLANVHAVPTETCPYHQLLDVDTRTHEAVLPACRRDGARYEQKSFVVLPSAVTSWLAERHRSIPDAPTFAAGCALDVGAPAILLPAANQVITLIPGVPAEKQAVALQASTRAPAVSWFVDGGLVASGGAAERQFWIPSVGNHEIVVTDNGGQSAHRRLVVKMGASQVR
jgi:penicillin-binding protein 1C